MYFYAKYKGNAKGNEANPAREARQKIVGVFYVKYKGIQMGTKRIRRAKRAGKLGHVMQI